MNTMILHFINNQPIVIEKVTYVTITTKLIQVFIQGNKDPWTDKLTNIESIIIKPTPITQTHPH